MDKKQIDEYFAPLLKGVVKDWDIQILETNGPDMLMYFNLVLYYPVVNISNIDGVTRELKDMYVELAMSTLDNAEHLYKILDFSGLRTTVSIAEYICGYTHSHLSTNQQGYYSFCTGSAETPISSLLAELRHRDEWTTDTFELFLAQMQLFLEWESADGGPYIYLRDVGIKAGTNPSYDHMEIMYARMQNELALGKLVLPLTYTVFGNVETRVVVDTYHDAYTEIMNKYCPDKGRTTPEGRFIQKEHQNLEYTTYMRSLSTAERLHGQELKATFRGKRLRKVITRPTRDPIILGDVDIYTDGNPEVIKLVTVKLNNALRKYSQGHQKDIQEYGEDNTEERRAQRRFVKHKQDASGDSASGPSFIAYS